MIRVHEEFLTKDEAEDFWRDYILQFIPGVYGAVLKVFRDRVAGMWVVSGHRFT